MLMAGAVLMIFAGVLFVLTRDFIVLLIAATIGVISPSGYEVGPFLSIEQSSLTQIVPDDQRTRVFAWYNLFGSFTTAAGSLCGGGLVQLLQEAGVTALESYRIIVLSYAAMGIVLGFMFSRLSSAVEVVQVTSPAAGTSSRAKDLFGLHKSRKVVFKLSALFSIDAFAGDLSAESRGLLVSCALQRAAGALGDDLLSEPMCWRAFRPWPLPRWPPRSG